MKEKKELEYPDAPSGYVTLYNYKEPFMKFDKGFGYLGVLLFDGESDKIQCHICGDWFYALGSHLRWEHKMTASKYKELVGLRKRTALIGEKLRDSLIKNGLKIRLKNLRPGGKQSEETKNKIRKTLQENSFQTKNENGTCPEQLIDRLKKLADSVGRTPSIDDVPFKTTLKKTFGTYKNACELAGIPYNDPIECLKRGNETIKITEEKAIKWIQEFYAKNNRIPKLSDRGMMHTITYKFNYNKLILKALPGVSFENLGYRHFRFTDEQLIEFMRNFEKRNGRQPYSSDTRRKLLPNVQTYISRFGSWKIAKEIAFSSKQ